jgi:hypothetical protein
MTLFPSAFGSLVGFNNNEIDTLTWNGTVSTSWNTVDNWTPNGAPSDFVNIIIPDASSTPKDPIVPPVTAIKSLNLKTEVF